MPKRFTDTGKWTNNKWFYELSPELKLFWTFLLDNCDNVGVWEENIKLANIIIGYEYSMDTLLNAFNKQIYIFKDKRKWWIKNFCDFQYGKLTEESPSKPIQSYIRLLKEHTLWIPYTKGMNTPKEKEKDKEQDKDKIKDKEIFEESRKIYPGTKRGLDTEFDNFKKHKDWKVCLPLLKDSIEAQIKWRIQAKQGEDKFVPVWKHLKTWINNRSWEEEMQKVKKPPDPYDFIHKQGQKFEAQFLGEEKQPT